MNHNKLQAISLLGSALANTLAYYDTSKITIMKNYVSGPGFNAANVFIYSVCNGYYIS